jgi:peptide/nickel transport system substrate-binding protein
MSLATRLTRALAGLALLAAATFPLLAQTPTPGGALRFGVQSEPRSLDPHMVITDGAVGHIVSNIFNTLVRYDENMNVVPDLAESWEIQEGGRQITFKLRENVVFHDGTPFNAEAVKFSFDRVMTEANNSPYRRFFAPVQGIEVLGPHSIRFAFREPWPGFFYQLLYVGGMGIVSPAAVQRLGADGFARAPVGTGPFKVGEWVSGQRLTLARNERYFRSGQPYLEALEFRFIPDASALVTALRTNQVELIRDFEAQLIPLMERERTLRVSAKTAYTFDWLALNSAQPPFNDPRVRHAINMAIDRNALARAVYGQQAAGATTQMAPANLFHHPDHLPTFRHDPQRARQLLAEAGASNLEFTLYSYTVKPQLAQLATVMQQQLGQIGVRVRHEVLEHQAWLQQVLRERRFQASVVPGTGGPEPHSYVMFWTSNNPINFVGIRNAELDRILPQAQVTVDDAQRRALYRRIQELGGEEASWMALVYVPTFAALNTRVQGYTHLPYNVSYFDAVWLQR